jgi:hypothetical protein
MLGLLLRGVMLDGPQTTLTASQRVSTQTGLSVVARILDQVYDIGRKCSETFRDIKDQFIHHDAVLGQWNYLVDGRGLNTGVHVSCFGRVTNPYDTA